jgi:hypothetical protein
MALSEESFSTLLATNLILGAESAGEVEDFFASRVCAQLVDQETGMWQLGCVTLAQAYRMELAGIDYQDPEAAA